MRSAFLFFIIIIGGFRLNAQRDSIFISAEWNGKRQINVQQKIIYYNLQNQDLEQIKLLNWGAAYQNKKTPLAKRKLEDGWTHMHFAKEEQLGKISALKISDNKGYFGEINENKENIYLPISLKKGEKKEIYLTYQITLPDTKITGYGYGKNNLQFKYFFIVPDSFEDEVQSPKYFLDLEETQNTHSYWKVDFIVPKGYFVQSNLPQKQDYSKLEGNLNTDLEIYASLFSSRNLPIIIDDFLVDVEFTYPVTNDDWANIEFYLPLHLKFIYDRLGWLPQKIVLGEKRYRKDRFLGDEDIKLFKDHKLKLFTDSEKIDLDYFSILSQEVLEEAFRTDKSKYHWLKNGLKTYFEIQYLRSFYQERLLIGDGLDWKILGMRPLRWMNVSNIKLIHRYGAAYLHAMNENTDQAIGTKFDELETDNQVSISQFKMGALLDFIAEKEGRVKFEKFLKDCILEHHGKEIKGDDFLGKLEKYFGESSIFIREYVKEKQRVDFRLKSMHHIDNEHYEIKISKNTPLNIPFHLAVEDEESRVQNIWLNTQKDKSENVYQLKLVHPKKLTLNPNFSFPEINYRNNFLQKRWFGFYKKIKFKLLTDLPNPEFNEIYIRPDVRYNVYDDVLVGVSFSNRSLISRPFTYIITPYMSIGERKPMGATEIIYKIQPKDTFFRKLILGASGAYFHYNYNLTYRKMAFFSSLYLREQNPRSMYGKKINFSYVRIHRDVSSEEETGNYAKYGLWNISFNWKKTHPIHEYNVITDYQLMKDFQKISLEGIYHWEFAPQREAHLRFFGGWFLKNKVKNNMFDYGISRINDYVFDHSLLGQSAVTGLFSQEFILAEAGFKSHVRNRANQWVMAFNADVPLWKVFHLYGDFGWYKNRETSGKFIWDSGVRLEILPSILSIYFPLQSYLGFEPSQEKYAKRIRFSLGINVDKIMRVIRKNKK